MVVAGSGQGEAGGGPGWSGDPSTLRRLTALVLFALCVLCFQLRRAIDVPGTVLDIDTVNFGLASVRFSLADHQPHPPGYPGYVLYLQAFGALFGSMGPVAVAKLANLVASTLLVPAAFWVCRLLLRLQGEARPEVLFSRPMVAALIAAVHPLLWFYGLDGQSHSAEALGTLVLFGSTLRVRARPSLGAFLGLVALFGLSGSIRPTLALLNAPMLLWLVWGRPLRWWIAALGVGIGSVAVWYVPLVWASGGLEMYQRATRALVEELFVSNMSPLSEGAHRGWIRINLYVLVGSTIFALSPLIGWARSAPESRGNGRRWRLVVGAIIALNLAFYGLIFISESGYLLSLAALSCLIPATWPSSLGSPLKVRGALAVVAPPLLFLLGPAKIPLPNSALTLWQPTIAHVVEMDVSVGHYVDTTCAAAQGQPMLVLTDNSVVTHTRLLPLVCPGAVSGIYLAHKPYNPDLDNWLIYLPDQILAFPTDVPLEVAPGVEATLPTAFTFVALGMDATEGFRDQVFEQARCAPLLGLGARGEPVWPEMPVVFPATCLPTLALGANTLHITPTPR